MKVNSMSEIAVIVQQERKRQGATQIELSQMANVGVRFLRDVEDGKPSVHFDILMLILEVLGVAVTPDGPLLLEGNHNWDMEMLQIVHHKGATARFRDVYGK